MPLPQAGADPAELMESALVRAVEVVGDITAPVMARYYARFPDAREPFDRHGLGTVARLEADMVETTLFVLMTWLAERPMVEILLYCTVPHHLLTLGITLEHFRGMVEETAGLIIATIPADCPGERAVWQEIERGVIGVIERAADDEAQRLAALRARAALPAAAPPCGHALAPA